MMTEVMRTAMKRTTALITFFASFARVIGPGRLHRSVGRLQGLVSPDQSLILCIVRSGPMMVRDSAVTKRSCTNRSLRCIMRPRWRTFSLDLERAKRLKGILQAFFRLFLWRNEWMAQARHHLHSEVCLWKCLACNSSWHHEPSMALV